jgi:hypothetical protein
MSTTKPHIKPKADPDRQRSASPLRDPPPFQEHDPRDPFAERDPWAQPPEGDKADENVIFREDDCLG